MFVRVFNRNKRTLVNFIGLGAAAALTFRFLAFDVFASTKKSHSTHSSQNDKLINVILLTRHGARTPLHIISGIEEVEYKPDLLEPFVKAKYQLRTLDGSDFEDIISYYDEKNMKSKLKGGSGRGQLTKIGEEQLYQLGRRIRERYVKHLKFISDKYDQNELYARSSHYRRTILSAKSLLSGIYTNHPHDVLQQPFVIHVHKLHDDYLFPNALNCSYFAEMYAFLETLSLYQNEEYVKSLNELNQALKVTDKESGTYTYTAFRDDMIARLVHGLPIPKHLIPFIEKADRFAGMEMTSTNNHNVKISCGQLLSLLKDNLISSLNNDKANNNANMHKFRYYSAHDSTLNALLVAFDAINDSNHSWPPFAADLIIELWKSNEKSHDNKDSNYFIKLIYCGEPLSIPTCTENNKCSFEKFIQLLEKNSIDKHEYANLCNRKFMS